MCLTSTLSAISAKKNYDQERHGGTFAEFATKQIDAVGAETAAAEYLGITDYEPQNGTFKDKADIADNVEVKHTYRRNGNLIIRLQQYGAFSSCMERTTVNLILHAMHSYSYVGIYVNYQTHAHTAAFAAL